MEQYFHIYNVEQLPVEYLGKDGNCWIYEKQTIQLKIAIIVRRK